MRRIAVLLSCLAATAATPAFPPLKRVPVLDQALPPGTVVGQAKGATIAFAPGQPSGAHRHPVPVIGVVTRGSFVFQPQGQPARILRTGDGFYEPAGVAIARFDNASPTEPAAITAFYLLARADQPLIEMLPAK